MKRFLAAAVCIVFCAVAFFACSNDDQGPSAGVATVTGFVKDASNRQPLSGVVIEGKAGTDVITTASTDAQGKFELRFEVDSAMVAKISIRNVTGYRDTLDISVNVKPNQALLKDVDLNPKSQVVGGGGSTSGLAQTIAFLGANPTQISVYGVGGQETAVLGFEARDSLGLPIDAAHAVAITFTLQGGPNGGEYISPTTLVTNAVGRAFIAFNSGIRSGVVQVLASATVGTRTITSAPVRVVINAGFPDQAHFTVVPVKHNFPTLGIAGNRLPISVLVGDRYSNPVVQNTAVYFRSSAGVVQPTVFTDLDGQGTVDLISGNPAPFGQYANQRGNGYHFVVARTIGQGGVPVQDSTEILWSGRSQITAINPATFSISQGGFQDFTFTVSDALGHPLASGTRISVVATVAPPPEPNTPINQVLMSFGRNGAIVLEDFLLAGPGTTDFSFRVSDGSPTPPPAGPPPNAVAISIAVEGPNGNAYLTINGTCN
jgi:hypothetical protein